jgi:hypothetical protein
MARLHEVARDLGIAPERLLADLSDEASGERQVETQRLERSFLAAHAAPGVPAAFSLGLRAQALALRRFDRAAAEAAGIVLPVAIPPAEARRRLPSPRSPATLVHRQVLNAALAIVYVPVWIVDIAGPTSTRRVSLDGLTGSVVASESGIAPPIPPAGAAAGAPRTLGLRPLVCPNCGWALPLRPDDVVFRCRSCSRAWLAQASRLLEVPQALIAAPPGARVARSLPVWELADRASGRVAYAPAFRCRRLRALVDLAARLVLRRPELGSAAADRDVDDLVGCAIDRHDAIQLARFTAVGLVEGGVRTADLRRPRARLLWLPFTHDGYAFCEAHTGASFPTRLLDLAA